MFAKLMRKYTFTDDTKLAQIRCPRGFAAYLRERGELLKDISDKIQFDFQNVESEAKTIIENACKEHEYLKTPRVLRCILFLSKGDLQELTKNINVAIYDPRDVMFWAEYEKKGFEANPKRLRNFNYPFLHFETRQTENIDYNKSDKYDFFNADPFIIISDSKEKDIRSWFGIFSIVFFISMYFLISNYIGHKIPKLDEFAVPTVLIIIGITLIANFFSKSKKSIELNYRKELLVYSYSRQKKHYSEEYSLHEISSKTERILTDSGYELTLKIYLKDKNIVTLNESSDNFTKNQIEELGIKIDQIKQDYPISSSFER